MSKRNGRVGKVSLRQRAIVAALLIQNLKGGVTASAIAKHQRISRRRALDVLKYAYRKGWLSRDLQPYRGNATVWTWYTSSLYLRTLCNETSRAARDLARARVDMYKDGKDA